MFRPLLSKAGANLKRSTAFNNGESSSSLLSAPTAKYFLFKLQNPNVLVESRVTSTFNSFSTTTASNDIRVRNSSNSDSFRVSYLINSCGLSEIEATTAAKKLSFKSKSKADKVLNLLKSYGFTESHISKTINKVPSILSLKPDKTLKPKLDFFKSKGLYGIDLADLISKDPRILRNSSNEGMTPSFDILKSIVQSDQNVIKMLSRNTWILKATQVRTVMVNLELLRNEGVPETNISKYLTKQPRAFAVNASRFKEIVQKVKAMGFDHSQTTFLRAIHGLASMSEPNFRNKMDVYKRWGWSEDQIQTAFRKDPGCMTVSEKKIMAIMTFLVDEMGYDSSTVAEYPVLMSCSLKERIIPRCSVSRILVSKSLIKEMISLRPISAMVDKHFVEKFVEMHKQEIPELMEVFQGQLNYQDLLQN